MVEGDEMFLPKLTVVGIMSDITGDDTMSATCEKDQLLNQLVESGKPLEVVKCFDGKKLRWRNSTQKSFY